MGYAPPAIQHLFDTVKSRMPSAQLGGIYGTKPGYHNCRANLPGSDYSVQKPPDKEGDAQAGSALDITWGSSADQKSSSQRLMNAKNDPRTDCLREFFGSVDGVNVCGWDFYGNYPVTSDDSHLWHIHLSFLRKYATNDAMLQDLADVITGQQGDDMNKDETIDLIAQAFRAYHLGGSYGPWNPDDFGKFIKGENNGVADRLAKLEKPNWITSINDAFKSYHYGGSHGDWLDSERDWIKGEGDGIADRLSRLEKSG
jgi:hypothetical protein